LTGTIGLFTILALLAHRGLKIALSAKNQYQRYLSAGITIYLFAQSLLIIGGNLRLLPLTGVTLPFISYGGSSLLTSFIAGTILLLISNEQEDEPAVLTNPLGFRLITVVILLSVLAVSLSNGWWSVIRSSDLQTRTDNPRNSIAEKYSLRGSILDRNNANIVITEGQAGNYWRHYLYPPLSRHPQVLPIGLWSVRSPKPAWTITCVV